MRSDRTSSARPCPRVFISYSHDDAGHTMRVRKFARRLEKEAGCKCVIDQDVEHEVSNWPQWMRDQIRTADLVLLVFTRIYRSRFEGDGEADKGRGGKWEGRLVQNSLYSNTSAQDRFVPVTFTAADAAHVPTDLFSGTIYQLPGGWSRLKKRIEALQGRTPDGERSGAVGLGPAGNGDAGAPRSSRPLSILFVGAEKGTGLDLHGQLKATEAAIARARYPGEVNLRALFDITPEELVSELHRDCPDVLHLSGMQSKGRIKMHDARGRLVPLAADQLAQLLAGFESLRLVVLDTCWNLAEVRHIATRVTAAVGIKDEIAEPVAINFYALFFNALASGASIGHAYRTAHSLELAKVKGDPEYRREIEEILECKFSADANLPTLVGKRGVDLEKVRLVAPAGYGGSGRQGDGK